MCTGKNNEVWMMRYEAVIGVIGLCDSKEDQRCALVVFVCIFDKLPTTIIYGWFVLFTINSAS